MSTLAVVLLVTGMVFAVLFAVTLVVGFALTMRNRRILQRKAGEGGTAWNADDLS